MNSAFAEVGNNRGYTWSFSNMRESLPSRLGVPGMAFCVLAFGLLCGSARAQSPTTPVLVTTSSVEGCTLGIPRWKGYMSPTNTDKFWLSFANDGSTSNNMCYTTDAGATWSNNTITIDAYMDYHLSLFGRNDDLNFTFSGVYYRRFASPAESINDAGSQITLAGTSGSHRANIMVQNNGRIWIFTRQGSTASENVRYQYSDNSGSTWTTGVAYATGASDVRIGSMPFVNGNPALVVLHLNDSRGYEYYLWNGSSFQARADHSMYAFNPGYDRCFTHNQINDTVMHLVFGQGTSLRHVWKNYANGTGAWNTSVIATEANNGSIEWYPISTVQGDNLYVFYCRKSSSDASTSRVYYRRWSQISRTWSSEYQVSTQAYSRDPNTCFQVPASADYIPVFYGSGSGTISIYFSKIAVTPQATDSVPPGAVNDLGAVPGPGSGQVTLAWSAPNDDDESGTSASYDIRCSSAPIDESNWASAIPLGNAPDPGPAGQAESFTASNLPQGVVYFALKACDDAGNLSPVSNLALVLISDVDDSDISVLLPERTCLTGSYPNPFNSGTRIDYNVATTASLTLRIYNLLGQEVRVLVDDTKPGGKYHVWWDGTDSRGSPVGTGFYFCRLVADNSVSDTRKLLFLK